MFGCRKMSVLYWRMCVLVGLVGELVVSLVGQSVGRSVGRLVGWLLVSWSVYMLGLEMKGAMIRLKRDATIYVGWCVLSFLLISYFFWKARLNSSDKCVHPCFL